MRYCISLMALFVIGISLLAACSQSPAGNTTSTTTATTPANNTATPAATKDPADSAPRISLADAKKAFDQGNIVVIDTRPAAQFQPDHIKGAINITVEELDAKYKQIPTGKKIIAYCS